MITLIMIITNIIAYIFATIASLLPYFLLGGVIALIIGFIVDYYKKK